MYRSGFPIKFCINFSTPPWVINVPFGMNQAECCLLGLFFDAEHGGDMCHLNVINFERTTRSTIPELYRKTNNSPWLFLQEELFLFTFSTARHLGEMVGLTDISISRAEYSGLKFRKYFFLMFVNLQNSYSFRSVPAALRTHGIHREPLDRF
jgi:hypothetical protein